VRQLRLEHLVQRRVTRERARHRVRGVVLARRHRHRGEALDRHLWRTGQVRAEAPAPEALIGQKVFTALFCNSQFPHTSVNLSFIITNIMNELADL